MEINLAYILDAWHVTCPQLTLAYYDSKGEWLKEMGRFGSKREGQDGRHRGKNFLLPTRLFSRSRMCGYDIVERTLSLKLTGPLSWGKSLKYPPSEPQFPRLSNGG